MIYAAVRAVAAGIEMRGCSGMQDNKLRTYETPALVRAGALPPYEKPTLAKVGDMQRMTATPSPPPPSSPPHIISPAFD